LFFEELVMKKLFLVTALSFAPAAVFAHPGHFDGAPFAHALAHGLYFFFAVIAVGIFIVQLLSRRAR
jgi:hypothetical protein